MIHKDDVLVPRVKTEESKYHLMLALEDEVIFGKGVRAKELNDWVSTERVVFSTETKIIGHAEPGEGVANIVRRLLPERMWRYTPALYRQNVMKNQTRLTAKHPRAKGGIILIKERTGEREELDSASAAARFLKVSPQSIKVAALTNSVREGWRVYEDPKTIRMRIKSLQNQLAILES